MEEVEAVESEEETTARYTTDIYPIDPVVCTRLRITVAWISIVRTTAVPIIERERHKECTISLRVPLVHKSEYWGGSNET